MAKKQITFADKAKEIKNKYKARVDKGDRIAISSMKRELSRLRDQQETIKAQQIPTNQFKYGGSMRRKYEKGGYTFRYYGATSEDPNNLSEQTVEIEEADANKAREADLVFEKYQGILAAIRNKEGDLTDLEIKRALTPEQYKELQGAYDTLTGVADKYEILAQSFGSGDTDTGSNLPQYFGRRFAGTTFDITGPKGEPVVQAKPAQQGQWQTVENQIDPYQINPMYDIGATAATTAPLLAHKFKEDPLTFDRPAPGYVSYENQREQARRDATVARNVGLQNLKNISSGSGQAAANALAMQTGLQSNLDRNLAASQEAEANRNAAIFGQNQIAKANIGLREDLQNYEDRRYVDEGNFQTASTIGRNVGNLIDRLKQNEMLELEMQSYNPDYMFNKDGKYVARRSKQSIPSSPTTQTTGQLATYDENPYVYERSDFEKNIRPYDETPVRKDGNAKPLIDNNLNDLNSPLKPGFVGRSWRITPSEATGVLPYDPDPMQSFDPFNQFPERIDPNLTSYYKDKGYVFRCGGKLKKRK